MDYKFSCQNCHFCCSGSPGYVFLSKDEIIELSNYTGLDFDSFIEIYCRKIDYGMYYMVSLKERDNYDCVFLTKDGCSVYSARPLQCRTYPFWKGIADSVEAWNEEAKSCPGIGKGKKYSAKEADEIMKLRSESYIILKK